MAENDTAPTGDVIQIADFRKPPKDELSVPMLQITVYDDGDVTLWVANYLTDAAQFNWAASKIAEATARLLAVKAERSSTL